MNGPWIMRTAACLALGWGFAAGAAVGANPYKPPIGGPSPGIARTGPAYARPAKPPPMTMPPPPSTSLPSPAITTPRSVFGPDCRASCATQCQRIACGGMNVSQCISVRQRCRLSCNSGC